MKRIAVLTWFNRGRNYGQTLQAFALNHTLRKMGFQCELLSYGKNGPRLTEEEIYQLDGSKRELQIKFAAFVKAHIDYSPRLRTPEEVRHYLQEQAFDAVVCGSDQIWNAAFPLFETVYLLDFPLPGQKVAYAAGMMDLPLRSAVEHYPQFADWLEDFDSVSVRENAGREIIRDLTGGKVDPMVVLDPTLLLTETEWLQNVEIPEIQWEPYIFCYMYHLSDGQKLLIQDVARENHCGTVIFSDILEEDMPEMAGLHVELARCVSIERFLSLVRHAQATVTDTFHGNALSIIFQKNFFSLESASSQPGNNLNRVGTLLEKAGLSQRMLRLGQEGEAPLGESIDYKAVNRRLDAERRKSLAWLEQALAGGAESNKARE